MDTDAVCQESTVTVVDRTRAGTDDREGSVAHGIEQFYDAIADQDGTVEVVSHWTESDRSTCVVVGSTESRFVSRLLSDAEEDFDRDEGVVYRWCETDAGTALVIAGTDDRGLMYALLEAADRVGAEGLDALPAFENETEFPDNEVRGMDRYIQGPVEDEWFYSDEFWHYYLAKLARCRYNRFVLISGYDSAFMSPPFPFLVDVPGYPEIELSDEVEVSRETNLQQLRKIGQLCDQYGLTFFFGIWQMRPWTENQGMIVDGVPEDNSEYAGYCAEGTYQTLIQCPEIDGLQLRVNLEAGVREDPEETGTSTAEYFWRDVIGAVERASEERHRELKLDLRAKGLTDRMIDWGLETGLDVAVPTKFSWESTGLPYHTTEMRSPELSRIDNLNSSRRYSYATLLRKPRYYDMIYRLWMVGTNRIFLWGDPDYARRFSHSAQFGDGIGYEVAAPLSLKGGHYYLQDEKWPLFDDPDLRHYEWEDERYWAWYLFFGRLGYSSDADPEIWEREFRDRFGRAGGDLLRAYRNAGKILPLLTSAHLTHHPAQTNWGELDTGGALFAENNVNPRFETEELTYANAEPGDPGLFYGVDEYVSDLLDDDLRGKYTPLQVARWYEWFAAKTREAIDAAGEREEDIVESGEFKATRLDLSLLADLAEYHVAKTHAAVELETYRATDEISHLQSAHAHMEQALARWRTMAERGEEGYHDDLVFALGPETGDSGQWKDRLPELEADLDDLCSLLEAESTEPTDTVDTHPNSDDNTSLPNDLPSFSANVPERCRAHEPVTIDVTTDELSRDGGLTLHYRHTDQTEGAFRTIEMESTTAGYRGTIPAAYVDSEWDLLVYFSTIDEAGNPLLIPGLYHAEEPEPYYVIETNA